jgi:tetratricopeptide (TPR) repeat protein
MRNSVGRVLAVAATLALAGACSPRSADEAQPRQAVTEVRGTSGLAPYLAGRFAQSRGDTRAAADFYVAALGYDPENLDLLQRAFTLLIAEGRLDEATPLARRMLTFDADSPMPLMVTGVAEVAAGRFAIAEKNFAALPHKGMNGFLGPMLTGWAKAGQGNTDGALEALAPLSKVTALAPIFEYHAGLITDLADRGTDAELHYKTALAGQVNLRTVQAAGAFLQRAGRMDQARELYAHYTGENSERLLFDSAARLAIGTALPRPVPTAKAGLAEALFDTATLMRQANALDLSMVFSRLTLALNPDFPMARLLLGDVLAVQGRYAESNDMFRTLAPQSPAGLMARLRMAVNLDEQDDIDGALKELRALADLRPADTDPVMAMGDLLRRRKRFPEAAAAYEEALGRVGPKPEPRHWGLFFARGVALERSSQWTRAEGDFLKALELKVDQPDVLNYLGYSWVDKGINLDRGRQMIEKAVSLRPNDGAIVDSLGWALYRMGEFQAAVKHLERAAELKPEDPTINDHLGDALWQVGRLSEARFQWQRALALDPEPDQLDPIKAKVETGSLPSRPLAQ